MNGDDGRLALLVALFDEFTIRTIPKEQQKISFLQEELQNTLRRPNSIQLICQAIESGSRQQLLQQQRMLPDNFLDYISTTANLSILQSVAFAVSTCQSQFPHVVADSKRFIRSKLPEILQINPGEICEDIYPHLMHLISKDFATPEISSNFLNALKNLSSSYNPNPSPSRISIARALLEKGPSCTANSENFRLALMEIGMKVTEEQLAELITLFVSRSLQIVTAEDGKPTEQFNSQFNLEVVAEVLSRECRGTDLNWTAVVQGFDQLTFTLRSEKVFQLIVRLFIRISGMPLPAAGLLRLWSNRPSQLAFLILAAASPRNLIDFSSVVSAEQKISGDNVPTPPNFSWLALPLYTTLLQLASLGLSNEVLDALNNAALQFPEYVLVCISQVTDPSNAVRAEILRRTLPLFTGLSGSRPTSFAVMKKLAAVNPDLLVLLFRIALKRASSVQDIQDIDNHLGTMSSNVIKQLEMEGSVEEFLGFWCVKADRSEFNLEEKIASLLEGNPQYVRVLINFAKTHIKALRPRTSDGGLLSFECFAVLIRASQNFPTLVPTDDLRALVAFYQSAISQHQQRSAAIPPSGPASMAPPSHVLGGGGGSNPNPSEDDPMAPRVGPQADEVEEEANAYFQKIYSSDISVPDIISLLRRFKSSPEKREQEIFRCMIHNLFDEVRFFHKYPDKELQVTGVLFGTLIQHQLVASITLGMALRYVLEALRKDPETDQGGGGSNDKMFRFGKIAIEQFRARLHEWPQYCSHLIQIPHLAKHSPEIFQDAQRVISNPQASTAPSTVPAPGNTPQTSSPPQLSQAPMGLPSTATSNLSSVDPISSRVAGLSLEQNPTPLPAPTHTPEPAQPSSLASFKSSEEMARMISTNQEVPIRVMPPESVRDQIHFIINNLAKDNLETKSAELKALMIPDYNAWFANYLVVKRISNQPNFHKIYLQAVLNIDATDLMNVILDSTYHNVTKLLQGPLIVQSTVERSLLRNLGIWLGLITLARNKPLLSRRINLKELLFWGYEKGRLIAVCSFVAKILEGCKESKVFRPPNPWLMAVLGVLRELYDLEDLKMNIKFEVQVLCRNIGVKIEDIHKTECLTQYRPPVKDVNNPDFTVKVNGPASMPPPSPTVSPNEATVEPLPTPPSLSQTQTQNQQPSQSTSPLQAQPTQSPNSTTASPPSTATAPSTASDQTVIPNLSSYIIINPSLQFFTSNPAQRRLVSIAVDRAIREIIQPVVERSVMIALVTTRQLILKDFATEPNEQNLRTSAHMMVSNLSGSLALVTCKEPLRISICNHLRSLLSQTTQDQTLIDQIVQVCSHDNLDLGSMLIEKASMEKAIREVDEALSAACQTRRKHRESDQPFFDPAYLPLDSSPNSSPKFPQELPDSLKTRIGGLSSIQLSIYEAFQRSHPTPSTPTPQSQSQSPPSHQPSAQGTASSGQGQASPISMSQAIEAYQQVLTRIDQFFRNLQAQGRELTLSMITSASSPADQEIISLSREIVSITQRTQTEVRNETALTIGETVFKNLMECVNADFPLRVEILVTILEALRDIINSGLKKISPEVVASWLESYTSLNAQDEICRKMHRVILTTLLRTKLLRSQEIDGYFASHMDMGREISWVEMALTFVRQCLNDSLAATHEFPRIFDTVSKMRPANNAVKKQLQRYLLELRQLSAAKEDPKPSPPGTPSLAPSAVRPDVSPREVVTVLLERWMRVWASSNDQVFAQYLQAMQQSGVLKSEEAADRFFKLATELCVEACLRTATAGAAPAEANSLTYTVIDALSKLFIMLIRLTDKESGDVSVRANLLARILGSVVKSLLDEHAADLKTQQQLLIQHQQTKQTTPLAKPSFDQRPYFRLLCNLTQDLVGVPDPKQEGNPALFPILHTYYQIYLALQPSVVPGFAFAWLQLISHRSFLPNLLLAKGQKGWPYLQRLLVSLLNFLSPFLKNVQMNDSIRKLYKGTLRMMLVLLHDFPEFLCDYHMSLCDAIPATCVQMRNLVLSAFPRSMRFPDPFTPNLKVDLLPEISQPPRLLAESFTILAERGIRQYIDAFMTSRSHPELPSHLPGAMMVNGTLSLPLLNATVAYVGTLGAGQLQNKIGLMNSPAMDLFKGLLAALDSEGRYCLFNSMANQLRYPNSHTHYFSYVLLMLFVEAESESVQDQITRVLLERLIAHKPHPWGLLITFIELIKNPRYAFWRKPFTRCSPQIELVFDSVARSCLGSAASTPSTSAPSTPSNQPSAQNQGQGLPPPPSPPIPSGLGPSAAGILGSVSGNGNGSWLK